MGELTIRKAGSAQAISMPALLEFHSPSAALSMVRPQGAARGTMWVTSSLVAACLAAAGLIPIDKVVTAPGKVVAQSPTTVVQPLEVAIVKSIEVKEGQIVQAGDVLARLDPTFATADLASLQTQVSSLQAEVDRLQAEASGETYRPKEATAPSALQVAIFGQRQAERGFKNENYAQKISSLQSQVQRAMSDKVAYTERLRLANVIVSKRAELEKLKVGSQLNLLDSLTQQVEAQRGLDSSSATLMQATRDLQAMQAERDGYNQQWRGQVSQELTDQGRKLNDAKEQLNKARLRHEQVTLRATEASIVNSIAKVSPGSVLQSGEQFFTLVPLNAPLEVEVNVAGTDAGFVHVGNPVTIKFDTFPATQYGTAEGKVRTVSADSFNSTSDERMRGTQQPAANAASFYKNRITIAENKLHDTPAEFRIGPGMPVTADIKVGERTLLSYLLSRVLPVAMDGMREP